MSQQMHQPQSILLAGQRNPDQSEQLVTLPLGIGWQRGQDSSLPIIRHPGVDDPLFSTRSRKLRKLLLRQAPTHP